MKAIFKKIAFAKEVNNKYGVSYKFDVKYDVDGQERIGSFFSDKEQQDMFKEGEENEFIETSREFNGKTYYNIAQPKKKGSSNYARAVQKEQARYSGFAMSYAKDLVCDGKIPFEDMYSEADKMYEWMVKKDRELLNGK